LRLQQARVNGYGHYGEIPIPHIEKRVRTTSKVMSVLLCT